MSSDFWEQDWWREEIAIMLGDRAVPCPHCGAHLEVECVTSSGAVAQRSHSERREAFKRYEETGKLELPDEEVNYLRARDEQERREHEEREDRERREAASRRMAAAWDARMKAEKRQYSERNLLIGITVFVCFGFAWLGLDAAGDDPTPRATFVAICLVAIGVGLSVWIWFYKEQQAKDRGEEAAQEAERTAT